MEKKIVVYLHRRKDTNEVFYVGIGLKDRPYDIRGRNNHWRNIVNKVGFNTEIIEDNLTWEEACERERYWIKFYGRRDLKEGNLVNMTDGGNGAFGLKHSTESKERIRRALVGKSFSEEHKKKISKTRIEKGIAIGKNNNMFGKKHTEESKLKMGVNIGRKFSEESRKRMSDSHRGLKRTEEQKINMSLASTVKKPVIQMDINGIFIAEWDSLRHAARQTNSAQSAISSCCIGNRNHHKGYKWKFKL